MVRAKFRVDSITQNSAGYIVRATPVTGGSPENEQFFKYTPGGSLELSTVNEQAVKQFAVGKSFYLDFTPTE